MASRVSDEALGEAEEALIACDYNYPLAWGLGFLIDNEQLLYKLLEGVSPERAAELKCLCKEIRTGVPQ